MFYYGSGRLGRVSALGFFFDCASGQGLLREYNVILLVVPEVVLVDHKLVHQSSSVHCTRVQPLTTVLEKALYLRLVVLDHYSTVYITTVRTITVHTVPYSRRKSLTLLGHARKQYVASHTKSVKIILHSIESSRG